MSRQCRAFSTRAQAISLACLNYRNLLVFIKKEIETIELVSTKRRVCRPFLVRSFPVGKDHNIGKSVIQAMQNGYKYDGYINNIGPVTSVSHNDQ